MSFTDRLRPALRYLFRGKTVSALAPSWELSQPKYAIGSNYEILVKEGYRKNELIFACLNATAAAASQISLELVRKRDGAVLDEHPLLDLIHRPNDRMNESDFWASVVLFQKLAGRAIYEIEYNNRHLPIALWPLRPDKIKIVQSEKRPTIQEYLYEISGAEPEHMAPRDVLDFPLFDPLDRFKSYPPVGVAARIGDVDNSATDYIKLIWEHGGIPQVYLKTKQALTDVNITDTRRRWGERYGGFKNWLEPAILDRDQDVHKLAWSFQEMGFEFLDARDEVRICMVLDVPAILVGAKAGIDASTYSNYELADYAWWRNDLLPMFNNLIDVIDYQILPIYDPNGELKCRWDVSEVMALQKNLDAIWKRATEAWKASAITRNQFFEQIGLDTLGPAGEVYYQPFNIVFTPAPRSMQLPKPRPVEGSTDEGKLFLPDDDKAANNAPDDDIRRKHERLYKKELLQFFDEQMKRIVKDAGSDGH